MKKDKKELKTVSEFKVGKRYLLTFKQPLICEDLGSTIIEERKGSRPSEIPRIVPKTFQEKQIELIYEGLQYDDDNKFIHFTRVLPVVTQKLYQFTREGEPEYTETYKYGFSISRKLIVDYKQL